MSEAPYVPGAGNGEPTRPGVSFYFSWKIRVDADDRLNTGCYAVAMALLGWADARDPCRPVWASASSIARRAKMQNRSTAQRHITTLTKLGYLKTMSWDDYPAEWAQYTAGRPGADKRVKPRLLTLPNAGRGSPSIETVWPG